MTRRHPARPPRALKTGARVALVAPAGPVDDERIERSVDRCRRLGLEPVLAPSAGLRSGYLAGPDEARLADLQAAFDDPAIDAVWALRGGYGTLRIVDRLDLSRQTEDPIPFIGFSDNTTVHMRLHDLGVISFHGPHPGTPMSQDTEDWFRKLLFRAEAPGRIPNAVEEPAPRTLVGGRAEGPLVGGNLAMLASMCGGPAPLHAGQHILFLEDVHEPAYRVDRMLTQLERAGVFEGVAGLAFGRFTNIPEEGSAPVLEVLRSTAERLGLPAVADLPFGHIEANRAIPVGAPALLDADRASLTITGAAVRV